jgi:multidrug efflux pump subunit AcrB
MLPSAGLGALLELWLFRCELDVISMIGIKPLFGIAKKNAVMMVDVVLGLERTVDQDPAGEH